MKPKNMYRGTGPNHRFRSGDSEIVSEKSLRKSDIGTAFVLEVDREEYKSLGPIVQAKWSIESFILVFFQLVPQAKSWSVKH